MTIQEGLGQLTSRIEKLELNQNQELNLHRISPTEDSSSSKTLVSLVDSLLKGIKLETPKFSGVDVLG